jgi:hypothetical protein
VALARSIRRLSCLAAIGAAAVLSGATGALLGDCGPFSDVTYFCAPILELFYLGVAGGTSPTTFAPNQPATRGEAGAFVARSFNQSIKRSSLRAALGQWWTTKPHYAEGLGVTTVSEPPLRRGVRWSRHLGCGGRCDFTSSGFRRETA